MTTSTLNMTHVRIDAMARPGGFMLFAAPQQLEANSSIDLNAVSIRNLLFNNALCIVVWLSNAVRPSRKTVQFCSVLFSSSVRCGQAGAELAWPTG
jgi:hypothetical protein